MGRRKQNPEDSKKRSLILKVAAKMFMTLGYTGVSMDTLADSVPVSKRTLYNHFKDKKTLFTAVMQARCDMLFRKLEQSVSGKRSAEDTLSAIGRQFLDLLMQQDSVNIYRTAITESQHFPELGKLFYESGPRRSKAILTRYFESLNESGEYVIPNPELATTVFLGMLKGNIHMQRLLGVRKSIGTAEKEEIVSYVVSVFLYGQRRK